MNRIDELIDIRLKALDVMDQTDEDLDTELGQLTSYDDAYLQALMDRNFARANAIARKAFTKSVIGSFPAALWTHRYRDTLHVLTETKE